MRKLQVCVRETYDVFYTITIEDMDNTLIWKYLESGDRSEWNEKGFETLESSITEVYDSDTDKVINEH